MFNPLSFGTLQTSVVTIAVYVALVVTSFVFHEHLPNIPASAQRNEPGLDLSAAWKDLITIAGEPHPYNSHANDEVREYILNKLLKLENVTQYMEVDDDLKTNVTTYRTGALLYFESLNILAKFEGIEPSLDGVMFSAHFDTSSLSPGATDDGMGVVTLLQVAQYFATNRPRRTIILNFSNGEEDGLHGAEVFLQHPWSDLVESVINLEGAGSGGRPNLFRSFSPQLTSAFASAAHPFGSTFFSDVFQLGPIPSMTDLDVYWRAGKRGVDYAFYMRRDKYHTLADNISSLGGKKPLWSMMENIQRVAAVVGKQGEPDTLEDIKLVYFDLFGETLLRIRYDVFLLLNVLLLVLAPILIASLTLMVSRRGKLYWGFRGWGRSIVALCMGVILAFASSIWHVRENEMAPYRLYYSVLTSIGCFTAFGMLAPLWIADYWHSNPQQRSQNLVFSFGLAWILAAASLILMSRTSFAGLYFLPIMLLASTLATLISLLDMFRLPAKQRSAPPIAANPETNGTNGDHERATEEEEQREDTDETTPLIPATAAKQDPPPNESTRLGGIWPLEFALLVSPVVILFPLLLVFTSSLTPTLVEGNPPILVYGSMTVLFILIFLPLMPFAHKLPIAVYGLLIIVGIIAALRNTLSFPFSSDVRFKAFFKQSIDLHRGNNTAQLIGLSNYLGPVIADIPSIDHSALVWEEETSRLSSVSWPGVEPRVDPLPIDYWLNVSTVISLNNSATIRFSARDTRACRLYFDHGLPVTQARIGGSAHGYYAAPQNRTIRSIELWSRTWEREWEVDVAWDRGEGGELELKGRTSCIWSERTNGKIPALDELYIATNPSWSTFWAFRGGLVEGYKEFSIVAK